MTTNGAIRIEWWTSSRFSVNKYRVIETNKETDKQYQIGDPVLIDQQEWVIADDLNGHVLLYRDSVDGQSLTMKYPKIDLPEKNEYR